ncbi:MAG TPA: 50S ribosomal protein L18 [Candidatus Deferrimicrobium sp.]|nr:50S ribosomal protein L18 [Candidatus Deferrimicrobium sp.]
MARGPRYRILFRRRRSGKTNFYYRKRLIVSNKLRTVVRSSLKHIIVQIVKAELVGDKILSSTHSSELVKNFDWKGATGNVPAAYLTGFLAGKKALQNEINQCVLDLGIATPIRGNRLFAALKGLIDAGIEIPHNEKIYPSEERIRGDHIANYAKIRSELEAPEPAHQFNLYKKRGLNPQELVTHFENVKEAITRKYK